MPEKVIAHPTLFPAQVNMRFIHGDIFKHDWSDAGLIFCNSTCFSRDMMDRIGSMPAKPGTIALTLTKNFNNANW